MADEDDDNIVDLSAKRDQLKRDLESGNIALATDERIDILKKLNTDHSYIKSYGGKPMVTQYLYNHVYNRNVLEFITPESFERNNSDRIIQEGRKEIEVGKWWMKNPQRRIYDTIFFDPALPREYKDCYNLWEGITITPAKGGWKCILKHIYEILCNKNTDKFKYVIRWLAWMVQNPGKRAETAIIFKGKEGAGKGFIFASFIQIYGEHGYHASSKENFVGRFTSHLGRSVFLFADEANLAGDREAEGVLKQLITEAKIPLEAKYKDIGLANNYLHIVMSTNQEWVIPAHDDSRRYFINEVDNKYAKNQISDAERNRYFDKLLSCMNNGGREAMYFDLQVMTLGRWHPRDGMPETEEMQKQVLASLPRLNKFLASFLNEGVFPGCAVPESTYCKVTSNVLFAYLYEADPELKKISKIKTADLLKKIGGRVKHSREGNYWLFPPLPEMKSSWEKLNGRFHWDVENEEWRFNRTNY